jgi:glycosyltransferase involved in cell wall biosynthesis
VTYLRSPRVHRCPGTARHASDVSIDVAVVCYFNPADVLGGSERIAWAEAELLSESRRVVFVSASPPAADSDLHQLRVGGWTRSLYQPPGPRPNPVKLVILHLLNLFNPFVLAEALRVFRRLRPSVVHTHNLIALSPAIWVAARLSGAKVVHTHHDLWLLCERATMTGGDGRPCDESQLTCRACRLLRPAKRRSLASVSSEVFPSRWLRERLGRRGPVIRSFSTSRISDAAASPHRKTVAYIGALTSHKLGCLLEAVAIASASGSRLQLIIAGTGPLEARVATSAESHPEITYLGQVSERTRDRVLREAAVLVIPSTCAENSPLVFFEAVAAGLPVIASDIGGMTELADWGSTVLVPPGDAEALAYALVSLLADDDRLAELGAHAREHRLDASPERFARQLESLIDALIEHR